jgi:O-antigen/teichoic acid export membrane protein
LLKRSFGNEYAGYWSTLVVLGINQLVAKMSLAPGRALLVLERANIILWAESAGFAITLLAAVALIPLYGILGAALSLLFGSLATTAVTVGIYLAVIREPTMAIGSAAIATAPIGGFAE